MHPPDPPPGSAAEARLILLVEDDSDIAEATRAVLSIEGFEVFWAAHGQYALNALREGLRPVCIVTDLMLPVLNGWELLKALEASPELRSIPVVVTTAVGADHGLQGRLLLRKPFSLGQLLRALRQVLPPR